MNGPEAEVIQCRIEFPILPCLRCIITQPVVPEPAFPPVTVAGINSLVISGVIDILWQVHRIIDRLVLSSAIFYTNKIQPGAPGVIIEVLFVAQRICCAFSTFETFWHHNGIGLLPTILHKGKLILLELAEQKTGLARDSDQKKA